MGRLYRPESEKPKRGESTEPELQTGRVYVGVTEPVIPEPDPDAEVVTVTEPAPVIPPTGVQEIEEPAGNASTDAWVAFARGQGADDKDLVDKDGNALGREALREKYGSKD